MEDIIKEINELRELILIIKNETVPVPGHSDIQSLEHCYGWVFEAIQNIENYIKEDML